MRLFRWTMLATTVIAFGACSEALKRGRCDQTSDCVAMSAYGAGYVCNLDPTPQGDGQCVLKCAATAECQGGRVCDFDSHGVGRCLFPTMDGGVDGADSGDGGGDACSACGGSTPVCVAGTCVECATSSDCNADPKKPICDTTAHTCGACTADSQCADKLGPNPGVCMVHQDSRCARDAETVYVQNTTGCDDAGGATAVVPFCSMTPVQAAIVNSDARPLVVVRGTVNSSTTALSRSPTRTEVSIVGQQVALIAAGAQPGLDIRSGLFYARDIKVSGTNVGMSAVPSTGSAVTLRLEHVTVDSCMGGGILLDGSSFDIRNAMVTRNGPATFNGLTPWGGVLINNPPTAGPKQINLSTVRMNDGGGISCSGKVDGGTDVLVMDNINTPQQVGTACGFSSCGTANSTCGAQ